MTPHTLNHIKHMTPSQLLERFGIPISETERQTRLSRHAMRLIDAGTAPDYMAKMWAVRYPNIEIPPKTAQINEAINELRRECQDWHEVAERLQSAYETIRAVRRGVVSFGTRMRYGRILGLPFAKVADLV
jgi:hypothetical protein